jgi:hypothetical protein
MCWWIFGHCWHEDEGGRRKLKIKSKCKLGKSDPYVSYTSNGLKFIKAIQCETCCICGKTKKSIISVMANGTDEHVFDEYLPVDDENEWKSYTNGTNFG